MTHRNRDMRGRRHVARPTKSALRRGSAVRDLSWRPAGGARVYYSRQRSGEKVPQLCSGGFGARLTD